MKNDFILEKHIEKISIAFSFIFGKIFLNSLSVSIDRYAYIANRRLTSTLLRRLLYPYSNKIMKSIYSNRKKAF